jgi:hypothetical protein
VSHVLYYGLLYLFIKFLFFYGLVRSQVRFDALKDHWLFVGLLYSAGIAFLSFVFIASWQLISWAPWQIRVARMLGVSPWLAWVGESFVLASLLLAHGEVR